MFKDDISKLGKLSNKKILCQCDYCKEDYNTRLSIINRSKFPQKHACKKCNFKKITEFYGSYGFQIPSTQEKIRSRIKEKWGVDNVSQSSEIQEKKREKYRAKNNGKTISEWAESLGKSTSTMSQQIKQYGLDVALKIKSKESGLELKFEELLKRNNLSYIKQFKTNGYIADFFIENKLIVETNGIYWHSDAIIKDNKYHKTKKNIYTNNNYDSIFFYENEINKQENIIESILLNKLNKSKKIYARKCELLDVETKQTKEFLNHNHLMGYGKGKAIGLYYNNELICCLQFTNKKTHLEIARFCSKIGHSVTGGFSKLVNYLYKLYDKDISTFIDARYGSGKYLSKLGFLEINNDISFKWVDNNGNVYHRMKFPGNSGYDKKMHKIWDCGQIKFIKYYNNSGINKTK